MYLYLVENIQLITVKNAYAYFRDKYYSEHL